jgi:hypothetical protein
MPCGQKISKPEWPVIGGRLIDSLPIKYYSDNRISLFQSNIALPIEYCSANRILLSNWFEHCHRQCQWQDIKARDHQSGRANGRTSTMAGTIGARVDIDFAEKKRINRLYVQVLAGLYN